MNEKPGKFENVDRLKVNTNILSLSNITEDPDNRSISFLYDLNVWNPYTMAKFWDFEARKFLNVSANCEKDMTEYLTALLAKEEWALKMIDATGRYTWGLLSGNVYWLGAVDQCREMEMKFIELQKSKTIERESNLPPFLVSMSSVTFNLHVPSSKLNEVCLNDVSVYRWF